MSVNVFYLYKIKLVEAMSQKQNNKKNKLPSCLSNQHLFELKWGFDVNECPLVI